LIVDAAISIPVFLIAMITILSLVLQLGKEAQAVNKMLKTSVLSSKGFAAAGLSIDMPMFLYGEGHVLCYRPFCGEGAELDSDRVYIFPKRGERFHVDGCSTMKDGEIGTVLTNDIKRKYSPCKICDPDELPIGSSIAIYGSSSKIYHRRSCATVSKSYECISRTEAISRGYTPCKLCLPDLSSVWESSGAQ